MRPDRTVTSSLEELRVQAKLLLKSVRSDEPARALAGAERLRRFVPFRRLAATPAEVKLKHALDVVALENGHTSWAALKQAFEATAAPPPAPKVDYGDRLYPRGGGGGLNRWFVSYDEARASLEAHGGYLMPYRTQFFVCESGLIEALGLAPDDPDWERIGRDWVRPADADAFGRLRAQLDGGSAPAASS